MVHRVSLTLLLLAVSSTGSATPVKDETISIRADVWFPMNGEPGSDRPGYMIEFAKAIFEPLGYRVDYQDMPWTRSLFNVGQGASDCVVGAYREDAPNFVFPRTHWGEDQNLFWTRADSGWQYDGNLSSLDGMRIGLIRDYAYSPAFDALMATEPAGAEFLSANNALEQNIRKLALGRIDVTVESRLVMEAKLKALGMEDEIIPAGRLGEPNPMYIACSPANPDSQRYVDWVDSGTARLRESGELQTILGRYGLRDWRPSPETTQPSAMRPVPQPGPGRPPAFPDR